MSLETRTTSAINKRAEQLRRWQESETNREPASPKSKSLRKIQFPPGCVFLAACAATDKDEVQLLLDHGADINTTNVDGLTALHQACIDNNLDMVEFLVTNGANINQGDNEGWTPLHTTASCGFTSIVRYLLDHGADISAVNNEGDLAYDICFMSDEMNQLLETEMKIRGINDEEARSKEERLMLEDVKNFLKFNDNHNILSIHPKTGATSLHVAASKGYLKVLDQLLKSNRLDIDKQDFDGWTALHAASYWGQSEACEMLIKHHADMEIKTYLNQTLFDIAKETLLDDLNKWDREQDKAEVQRRKLERKRFEAKMRPVEQSINQLPPTKVKKISNYDDEKHTATVVLHSNIEANSADSDNDNFAEKENIDINSKTYQPKSSVTISNSNSNLNAGVTVVETLDVPSNGNNVTATASDVKEFINSPLPLVIRANDSFINSNGNVASSDSSSNGSEDKAQTSLLQSPVQQRQRVPWKRPDSLSNRVLNDSKIKAVGDSNVETLKSDQSIIRPSLTDSDVSLRRTQSFESDKKFYLRYLELHARIKASSHPVIVSPPSASTTKNPNSNIKTSTVPERLSLTSTSATTTTNNTPNSSSSAIPNIPPPPPSPNIINNNNNNNILSTNYNSCVTTTGSVTTESTSSTPITSSTNVYRFGISDFKSNFSNTNDIKSDVVTPQQIVKRSFVPPVRDEESETQRKAHAKRVRETRRSTQGVTLDEIKSAEELIKKQQQQQSSSIDDANDNNVLINVSIPASQQTNSKNSDEGTIVQDRRPSWRLRVDNGSKFALEDASKEPSPTYSLTSPFNRRHSSLLSSTNNRPTVTTITNTVTSNSSELLKHNNDIDSLVEKETTTSNSVNGTTTVTNSSVNLATQAAIQRRRRPKRRSTGVVSVDLDEIINAESVTENGQLDDKKESDDDRNKENSSKNSDNESKSIKKATENGEIVIDYKKLWEESQLENGILKDKLRKAEGELREAKDVLDRINSVTSKNSLSLSELEKREKRAMERKLSEMEEELKQLQKLKAENERLRTENKALTRVVNKLSNSTIK